MTAIKSFAYRCPECGESSMVEYEPEILPKTYGPPEDCHPGEPERFTPNACPECDTTWDSWVLGDAVAGELEDYRY